CASCHDHKFDPVPTRDYYRMQAIFAPVQFAERPVPFLATENIAHFSDSRRRVEQRIERVRQAKQELEHKSAVARAAYLREHGVKKYGELLAGARPPGGNFGREFGLSKTEQSVTKIYEKNL